MASNDREYTVDIEGDLSETGHYALFSGGNDSLAATHYVMEQQERPVDRAVYLDTRSGLPENLEHVRQVCEDYGWPLVVASAPIDLYEFATGAGPGDRDSYGFPGPGAHSWAYRYFKERGLRHIARQHEEKPVFYTGVRSHESDRRMRTVDGPERDTGKWLFRNPIHDWRDERVDEYREEHDLPENPVAQRIGRSGDCYCGAFASRTEELVELEAHYPEHAQFIKDVERRVQEELGTDQENCFWGYGDMSATDLRALLADNDEAQMALCSTCDIPDVPADLEVDDAE